MASLKVNNYINKAYPRWLEYAKFQCATAHLYDQEGDVLNETIADVLSNNTNERLEVMIDQELTGCTGFDAFVLSIIRRNAHLPRASYRWTYCKGNFDHNVDVTKVAEVLENENAPSDFELIEEEATKDVYDPDVIKDFINESDLSPTAKDVFLWKFEKQKKLKDYESEMSKKEVYETYSKTLEYLLHKHNVPTRQERKANTIQLILF